MLEDYFPQAEVNPGRGVPFMHFSCLPVAGPAKAELIPSLMSVSRLDLPLILRLSAPWTGNSWRAKTVSGSLGLRFVSIPASCTLRARRVRVTQASWDPGELGRRIKQDTGH